MEHWAKMDYHGYVSHIFTQIKEGYKLSKLSNFV